METHKRTEAILRHSYRFPLYIINYSRWIMHRIGSIESQRLSRNEHCGGSSYRYRDIVRNVGHLMLDAGREAPSVSIELWREGFMPFAKGLWENKSRILTRKFGEDQPLVENPNIVPPMPLPTDIISLGSLIVETTITEFPAEATIHSN